MLNLSLIQLNSDKCKVWYNHWLQIDGLSPEERKEAPKSQEANKTYKVQEVKETY